MFPYYHMTIRIPLRQFDRTIFEGVIVVLTKNMSSKSFYTQLLVFFILNGFTENFEWLGFFFPFEELHIFTAIWSNHFLKELLPFLTKRLYEQLLHFNSYMFSILNVDSLIIMSAWLDHSIGVICIALFEKPSTLVVSFNYNIVDNHRSSIEPDRRRPKDGKLFEMYHNSYQDGA